MNKDAAHPGIIRVDRWLSIFLLLIAFNANAHQGFYLELGIGKNGLFQEEWIGRDSTACMFGAGYEYAIDMNNYLDVSYRHNSQCTRGNGFDGREEDANDSAAIYYRYRF